MSGSSGLARPLTCRQARWWAWGGMPWATPVGGTSRTPAGAATSVGPGTAGDFAKVPGLDSGFRLLTRVLPLGRAAVTERGGELYLADSGRRQQRGARGRFGRQAHNDEES